MLGLTTQWSRKLSLVNPFVFSNSEYARVMRSLSSWMHMLAEILPSESFIIAGTSLNEVDLEYYLSNRTERTPRSGRGPSILIEPYPDAATEADCARYGLTLVKGTLGEFLSWIYKKIPSPPNLSQLIIPDSAAFFQKKITNHQLLKFFTDFSLNKSGNKPRPPHPSPFLYGREPRQEDIDENFDIDRADNENVIADIEKLFQNITNDGSKKIALILDEAGTGKSTIAHRVSSEFIQIGRPVLSVQTLSKIDVKNSIDCISSITTPILLIVDHFADHIEQILEIIKDTRTHGKIIVLGCERSYRKEYIDLVLGQVYCHVRRLRSFSIPELLQLVELYREYGLIAEYEAIRRPENFAHKLNGDTIAIAVCRVLKDFKPISKIIESLWSETKTEFKFAYLCSALSVHCHSSGLRYSVLQKIIGASIPLNSLLESNIPLGLTASAESDDYVVPLNSVYANLILMQATNRPVLLEAFRQIANGLAPYVNRNAIRMRTPEARLAGRLLDADKIVKPLLGNKSNELYEICQKNWAWTSRFWEQRALLVAANDIDTGLHYARHAVAIEKHSHSLTTLGKILFMLIDKNRGKPEDYIFAEAFECLNLAIEMEGARTRIAIHPFYGLFSGVAKFLELGGKLTTSQKDILNTQLGNAEYYFKTDRQLIAVIKRLDTFL